jgi:hypothetical protein
MRTGCFLLAASTVVMSAELLNLASGVLDDGGRTQLRLP